MKALTQAEFAALTTGTMLTVKLPYRRSDLLGVVTFPADEGSRDYLGLEIEGEGHVTCGWDDVYDGRIRLYHRPHPSAPEGNN